MPPKSAKPSLTHFLCVPLVTPTSRSQLQNSVGAFRTDLTSGNENTVVPEKAVRPAGTLHLTLGVMSLLGQERIESALTLLASLNLKEMLTFGGDLDPGKSDKMGVLKEEPDRSGDVNDGSLKVTLRGLQSMHTPWKTSILYSTPVDPDSRLSSFCCKLKEAFTAAGLLVPDARPLLLHATIVNTVYVPGVRGKGSGHGKSRAKLTIDARHILEKYKDFEWMRDVRVEKVAICKMGAKKLEDGEEEYVVEGEVDMP
ncbi:hypothetical protein B7494_g2589 [Chlorociboria aeruginascens]|nr:hypothetical protein B7494_g2589 [Chlorociboria aeruginascens]